MKHEVNLAESATTPRVRIERDELVILNELVPLEAQNVIELGCGNARLARQLLERFPRCRVTGLEVDTVQHARNLAEPAERLTFVAAGAQAIPLPDAQFDLALMLKSLHHVPLEAMDTAFAEVHRVLRPGGWLYVSEPVYAGALNEVTRLFNDEGPVRAAAQAAVNRAVASGRWRREADVHFDVPVAYTDFADFAQRMFTVTYADRQVGGALREQVREAFERHATPQGARFTRPMHVTLLRSA